MTRRLIRCGAVLVLLWIGLEPTHYAAAQGADTVLYTPPPPPGSVLPVLPGDATPEPAPPPAAQQPRGVAGWYPDQGFWIKSNDANFGLRVGLQAGYRLQNAWRDGAAQDRKSFFVLRPLIAGHVFRPWIRFWTALELAQDVPFVLDSYVEIQPVDQFGVRIGQQYTPLSRHEYLGPQQILMPDWAPIADYFWTGRDKGITVLGTVLDKKLDYYAGIFAGSPPRQSTSFAHSWVANARVTVNPMGPVATNEAPYIMATSAVPTRMSLTLQAAAASQVQGQAATNPSPFGPQVEASGERNKFQLGGADFWLQGPRFVLFSEVYIRRAEPKALASVRAVGFWGQLGVMVVEHYLDVGARFNWLDPSQRLSNDVGYTVEGQIGYYPFKNQQLVGKLRYGYGNQQQPGSGDLRGATLLFAPGTAHLITLQLMLAI